MDNDVPAYIDIHMYCSMYTHASKRDACRMHTDGTLQEVETQTVFTMLLSPVCALGFEARSRSNFQDSTVHTHVHNMYIHTYMHIYMCMCIAYITIHAYAYIYIYVYSRIYVQICIYIYIYAYLYICIYAFKAYCFLSRERRVDEDGAPHLGFRASWAHGGHRRRPQPAAFEARAGAAGS